MKYPALAPPIGGQVIIVVNLLNHEKSRGRTSSAASCLMEDVMALGARSPTPAQRSVSPTFMPYKNVTRGDAVASLQWPSPLRRTLGGQGASPLPAPSVSARTS